MLNLKEIKSFYPQNLHRFERFILREYLQHKILQIIFSTSNASKFCFLGGTLLRIIYENHRFSEDLDFDNLSISEDEFQSVAEAIKQSLEKEGYNVEITTSGKDVYHCYIKFPDLLQNEKLANHHMEKILIQIDTEPQKFDYVPERLLLNKFDVFSEILCTPKDIVLAQKFYAILNRKRNKGRDFFDVMFLKAMGVRPNYRYLEQKLAIKDQSTLKAAILEHCSKLSMDLMAQDVAPFLFNQLDIKKIQLFPEYIKQSNL